MLIFVEIPSAETHKPTNTNGKHCAAQMSLETLNFCLLVCLPPFVILRSERSILIVPTYIFKRSGELVGGGRAEAEGPVGGCSGDSAEWAGWPRRRGGLRDHGRKEPGRFTPSRVASHLPISRVRSAAPPTLVFRAGVKGKRKCSQRRGGHQGLSPGRRSRGEVSSS